MERAAGRMYAVYPVTMLFDIVWSIERFYFTAQMWN